MKFISKPLVGLIAALIAGSAAADIRITEVAPWASGNSPYAGDWFELTNTGSSAVSISGWKVDDSSNSFNSAIALSGLNNNTISQLSVVGVNGAHTALNNIKEIGSPGMITPYLNPSNTRCS